MKLKETILRSIIKKQIKNLLFEQQQSSVFSGDTWSFWNGNKQIDGLTFEELTNQLQNTLKTKDKSRLLVWNENFEDSGLPDAWIEVANIPATVLVINGDNSLQKINSIVNPSEVKPQTEEKAEQKQEVASEPEATVSQSEETKEEPAQQEKQEQEEESGGPLGNEFYNMILKLESIVKSNRLESGPTQRVLIFIKNNLDKIINGESATLESRFKSVDYNKNNFEDLIKLILDSIFTVMFLDSTIYNTNYFGKAKNFSQIKETLDNLYSICSETSQFFIINAKQFKDYNVILPTNSTTLQREFVEYTKSKLTISDIPTEYKNFVFRIEEVGYKQGNRLIKKSAFIIQ